MLIKNLLECTYLIAFVEKKPLKLKQKKPPYLRYGGGGGAGGEYFVLSFFLLVSFFQKPFFKEE